MAKDRERQFAYGEQLEQGKEPPRRGQSPGSWGGAGLFSTNVKQLT